MSLKVLDASPGSTLAAKDVTIAAGYLVAHYSSVQVSLSSLMLGLQKYRDHSRISRASRGILSLGYLHLMPLSDIGTGLDRPY